MTMKKRKRKWLSQVLTLVLVLGLVSVPGITAKAATITEVAVTVDLPVAEEAISACGTPTVTSDIYTVEVYKWLEGSYETADDVSTAVSDGTKVLTNTDTLEEKKSYTVIFQATTYGAAGNQFGDSMTLTVNGDNALFVNKKSYSFGNQANVITFAYTFTVPETVEYNLKIGGVAVKSNNLVIDKKDTSKITGGSFTFDPETYTLTMDNVVASGDFGDYFIQYSGEDDLTIQVVGTNSITFTAAGWQGIRSDGKGNLRITSESDGELLIKGTALKMGIYFREDLILDGSLKLTCNIQSYDSATGLRSDSGSILTVEDGVKLFVYTNVDANASSPVSQGIYAKVIMNGGEVNIESSGPVSKSVLGIGPYTQVNGGVLTVACAYQAAFGSLAFDYPGAYPKITASTNYDGSDPVTYNSSNKSSYKYIKVEKGDPKTAIESLTLDTLYKPVAGEMPAYPAFSDGTDNIYYDWNWCVWDEEAEVWSSSYDEEGEDSVGDSVFREGEKYALKLFVYPKSAYTFPSTMIIKHNEVDIPNYVESNPNVTYKKISSSGSSLELLITEDDMPVNTKTPVTSAGITINGYQYGKNAEDITVTLDAEGADFYKDEIDLPSGWYLAIDEDCDGEPEGIATGALKADANYNLAVGMEAKEGYRVSSLTKEKITLSDGTVSIGDIIMCNASEDMLQVVYKLPMLSIPEYNISVTDGKATASGTDITKAKEGTVVTLTANAAPTGKVFDKWVVVSGGITLADANSATTTFTMPAKAVEVKAAYKADSTKNPGDHSYSSEWSKDAKSHWHACACGDKKDVAEHTYDAGKVTKEPTETAEGVKTYTCTVCGMTKTEVVPATGKTDGGDTDTSAPAVGEQVKDIDGKAVYKVTGADAKAPTVEYTAPVSKTVTTITIPATIEVNGTTYKVTSIAKNAFKNNKKIKKVTIGSNVKTIGAGAFYGCTKLKTVTIGKNVTTIGDKAFYKCTTMEKLTIPSKVTKIGKSAFYGCKKLKTITIKTTKLTDKKVGSNAFKGIHSKATITVPKSKLKAYTTLLKKKGIGKGVKVKK